MDRVIIHSDANCFYASVEMLYHPEFAGKPLAVGGDPEARHGIVLTANYIAKKHGVKTGMALWQARQACPDVIFVPPRMDLYLKFSSMLREIYGEYTDKIEPYGCDEAWLDVSDSSSLKGDGRKIADEISARVKKELGITVSEGISWNKMEMIVDEMLAILNDRDAYVQKQIEKNRRIDLDDLFIRGFDIRWNEELQDSYVYQIPAIANIDHFEFKSNITFFVGENGSGKSTLLEAFAVACGLNPEGGTANYRFSTYDDYSDLASAIKLRKGVSKPKWRYFLRAESFYNVASALMTKYNDDGKMQDLHARSHGESFLDFIQRADQPGLYIMDEPEAALSPQRQLTLLIHLVKMAQKGAQFVIVTHSPILLAIPDADIFSFDEGSIRQIRYEDTESYQITKMFLDNREYMLKKLLAEDDDE